MIRSLVFEKTFSYLFNLLEKLWHFVLSTVKEQIINPRVYSSLAGAKLLLSEMFILIKNFLTNTFASLSLCVFALKFNK